MSHFADLDTAIRQHFMANFSEVPVYFEEQIITKVPTEYARLMVSPVESNQISLARNPTDRLSGIVAVQLFVQANKANTNSRLGELADLVATIFTRLQLVDEEWRILFRVPTVKKVGTSPEYPLHQWNVVVEFLMDSRG
ncbi:hypothetical protein [Phenylobacterium sp. SCN 70-31]|uniref:hypothetical protein n=1 Tax=Phenylobacterium sp. SCN 70-31 TaxID=1660129 RepID=UPI0025DA94B0|nr:hypothetical protein [Phenylobacterium sp. SCN 70-31]